MGNPHLAAMRRLFEGNRMRHDTYTLFGDCMEAMAIAMSNAVDLRQRETREARYLEIVGRYERDIVAMFPQVMVLLAAGLEHERDDLLGALFHDLELHNTARGQFFTPYTVSRMMAEATLGSPEHLRGLVEARGFVTAMEPACGAGSMVIALADAMQTAGINYQRHPHGLCAIVIAACSRAFDRRQFAFAGTARALVHAGSYPRRLERAPQGCCSGPGRRRAGFARAAHRSAISPTCPGGTRCPAFRRAHRHDASAIDPFLGGEPGPPGA